MLSGPPKIRVLRCLIYLINNFQVDWTLISKVIKNLLKMVDESTDVVTFQQSITFVRFVSDGIPTTWFLDIRSMDAMMSKIIAVWSTLEHFADERSDAELGINLGLHCDSCCSRDLPNYSDHYTYKALRWPALRGLQTLRVCLRRPSGVIPALQNFLVFNNFILFLWGYW